MPRIICNFCKDRAVRDCDCGGSGWIEKKITEMTSRELENWYENQIDSELVYAKKIRLLKEREKELSTREKEIESKERIIAKWNSYFELESQLTLEKAKTREKQREVYLAELKVVSREEELQKVRNELEKLKDNFVVLTQSNNTKIESILSENKVLIEKIRIYKNQIKSHQNEIKYSKTALLKIVQAINEYHSQHPN